MPRRPVPEPETALYVRLPAAAVDKLDRASDALGVPKKDLVAGLVTKYVDPDSRLGLAALGMIAPRRVSVDLGEAGPTVGSYSFQPHDAPEPPEVMTVEQTAELLQLEPKAVLELAEAGTLPGKKLGTVWRFSRTAVLAWLGTP
jgi:excisionase family DNA binding protein